MMMTANHNRARTLFFKPDERNIFFHLLTACNLRCRHCYINPEQHGSSMVSRATMEEWLRLFAAPEKESNIIFLGGEPSLHPDLVHGVRYARELGYCGVTIDTNGFLYHDLLTKLQPYEAVLSFSLDGPDPAVNDAIRGKGVFNVCTTNLQQAVAKGFEVSLIYTVSQLNIDHLPRMPALLEKIGCQRFFMQVIGIRGKSAQTMANSLQLTPEQWLKVVPAVAAEAAARGIHVIYPKVYLGADEPFQCAGRQAENYFIFPNGRVYLCPLCEDFPLNAWQIDSGRLVTNQAITEKQLFSLNISEGCVINKLLQPGNIVYDDQGFPLHRISCCLLKQEIAPV